MQNLVWWEVAGAKRTRLVPDPARFAELLGQRCAFFFAMVIYYEKFQLFCVVHFQNATYLLFKVHLRRGIIIICPNPPYCNLHTQSWKETSNGFKMGFTFAIWRGYIAPRLSLTIALSFYDNFSQLGFHDIKRLQFSVRGASDQISPLHCKCLIFQPILDWIAVQSFCSI